MFAGCLLLRVDWLSFVCLVVASRYVLLVVCCLLCVGRWLPVVVCWLLCDLLLVCCCL